MIILFDIGGTRMRIAGTIDGKEFSQPLITLTPQNFEDGMALFKKTIEEIACGEKIEYIFGGITGILNSDGSTLLASPHLLGWANKPLRKSMEDMTGGAIVRLENDSVMVGLGEAIYGAGRGGGILVYVTVSTGVGGARFIDNKIDVANLGFEPGHQIIQVKTKSNKFALFNFMNPAVSASTLVTLEDMISGSALEAKHKRVPREITDMNVWDECAYILAVGLHNTFLHWSPERLVLGGAMFNDQGISIERVKEHLIKIARVPEEIPEIKKSELKDIGGLYGSMALYNQTK
jgi:glucokinase